ncbi:MAG: inositol monophosphatase family protein [Solirubrobacterales bacterium]
MINPEAGATGGHETDPALTADWLGICRRVVERQRVLFEEVPTIAARYQYDGIGEGGDQTLVLDRLCEDIVFEELDKLAGAGSAFTAISEERGLVQFNGGGETWVVIDPIDGSLNVRRTMPNHSLSIAVASAPNMSAVEFGFVYDFGAREEYSAHSGQGAVLNGRELKVEPAAQLEIVGVEGAEPGAFLPIVENLVGSVFRFRCVGSLAITLSYLAAGRIDGMVTPHPSRSVDIAAAQLIAREAGALVELGEDGLGEVGLDLDHRFTVTGASSAEGLATLIASRS